MTVSNIKLFKYVGEVMLNLIYLTRPIRRQAGRILAHSDTRAYNPMVTQEK